MVSESNTNTHQEQYVLLVDDLHNITPAILSMVKQRGGTIIIGTNVDLSDLDIEDVGRQSGYQRGLPFNLIELVPSYLLNYNSLECFFDCTINYILCLRVTAVILLLVLQHIVTIEINPTDHIRIRSPTRVLLYINRT